MKNIIKIRFFYLSLLIFSSALLFSCKSNERPVPDNTEKTTELQDFSIKLNTDKIDLWIADEVTLIPTFSSSVSNLKDKYEWKVADNRIADITVEDNFSVKVVGKTKGVTKAFIVFKGEDKALVNCDIIVKGIQNDGLEKVLAIGNSFSDDAVEHYLYGLADAAGEKIIIGNMYIGGAKLGLHWENAEHNKAAYSYRKIGEDGTKTTTANTSIATVLADEDWDYISFQQASIYSGRYSTFITPLSNLYSYVKERAINPGVKYVLHQTWAYAQNSTHAGYDTYYDSNQQTMYEAIIDAYKQAKTLIHADMIIPDGTAIQNGRTSVAGDNFNRDGHHLNILGRYTASCTWFEAIFDKSVVGNTYKPDELTAYEAEIAQHAAHLAVAYPDKVSQMLDYQNDNLSLTDPVFINFGRNKVSSPIWNSLSSYAANTSIMNLLDVEGKFTGVSIRIKEKFSSINTNGPKTTTTDFDMPQSVSSDNFYGHLVDWNGRSPVAQGALELGGLDKFTKYNFCFFSGRAGVSDNRETKFIVKGKIQKTALLNAANNTSDTACLKDIQPKTDGTVTVIVTAGDNNTEPHKFYYLTAMKVSLATN